MHRISKVLATGIAGLVMLGGALIFVVQQQIFAGRDLPPPELDSDDEVVKYVLRYPGAIGYVSAGANVGAAKIVTVK